MKNFKISLFLIFIFAEILFSQQPGEAYYPETANGAQNIHSVGHSLSWRNPDSTVYNIIYFSEDSILVASLDPTAILFNGSPSTVYETVYLNQVEPLDWLTKYYWRVVEFYGTINIQSPIWTFTTRVNFNCDFEVFIDDFENGLTNWTISNDGGNCVWEIFSPPYGYNLPCLSSCGNVLAADSDECGDGTSTRTSITLNEAVGSIYGGGKVLEFDSDWRIIDMQDEAYVEISTNSGQSWNIVWQRIGVDERNSHEVIDINVAGGFLVKFRTIQPGWDWWWAVDNVHITENCPITIFYPPYNLRIITVLEPTPRVELNWSRGTWVSSTFQIKRKDGLPTDPSTYSTIGQVSSSVTTFIDNNVQENQIYTYQISSNPVWEGGLSNEATAYIADGYVPVELVSFTAMQLNSKIILSWQTATEINNSGFEIQKRKTGPENQNSDFIKIAFVTGYGSSTEKQVYSFTDDEGEAGNFEYRLKQIDYDGSFEYSNIVEVTIDAPKEFTFEQNYPNPFNPTTKIKYSIPSVTLRQAQSDIKVILKVYDVLGNEIATLVNEVKQPGVYEVEFNATAFPSGIYFYRLKAGSFVETKKMILLR